MPHVLDERVATDRDAVYGISRVIANGSRSGQPDHKQHPIWTNESAELIESFSVVDVVEHRYSCDDVERVFLENRSPTMYSMSTPARRAHSMLAAHPCGGWGSRGVLLVGA